MERMCLRCLVVGLILAVGLQAAAIVQPEAAEFLVRLALGLLGASAEQPPA